MVERIADSDVDVLIRGESGVGKDVVARELHRRSAAALEAVRQGQLRGAARRSARERAVRPRARRVHRRGHDARRQVRVRPGGTIMLDEIGEMPPALQAKLLHVLQDREFTRLGSNRPIDADVRVLAATNRDLEAMMGERDLPRGPLLPPAGDRARVPPLRDRREEIPSLVEFFLAEIRGAIVVRRCVRAACCRGAARLLVAGQHPRAREHDEALRRAAGGERWSLGELGAAQAASRAAGGPRQRAAADGRRPAGRARVASGVAVASRSRSDRRRCPAAPASMSGDAIEGVDPDADGVNLQDAGANAAMRAEREAIEQALVHPVGTGEGGGLSQVSYKTLLTQASPESVSISVPPLA